MVPNFVARHRVLANENVKISVSVEIDDVSVQLVLGRVESRRSQFGNGVLLKCDA